MAFTGASGECPPGPLTLGERADPLEPRAQRHVRERDGGGAGHEPTRTTRGETICETSLDRGRLPREPRRREPDQGEIVGDEVTAVAMIDRLVHYAEILSLKGDSYRLQGKDLGARPSAHPAEIT